MKLPFAAIGGVEEIHDFRCEPTEEEGVAGLLKQPTTERRPVLVRPAFVTPTSRQELGRGFDPGSEFLLLLSSATAQDPAVNLDLETQLETILLGSPKRRHVVRTSVEDRRDEVVLNSDALGESLWDETLLRLVERLVFVLLRRVFGESQTLDRPLGAVQSIQQRLGERGLTANWSTNHVRGLDVGHPSASLRQFRQCSD